MAMDPQSVAFIPSTTDSWRLQNELARLQQVQSEHSDRLSRLERRHDDDARMKSVWGGASPFPSILSGTLQQAPLQQPPEDHFKDFDDESSNLIGSLHLDADEEPRRMGATSRANSVRFDESANQGHWAHASRSSLDMLPRSASSLGGLPLSERTPSHKSEGRASSVHSVRSATSGRASSLVLDHGFGLADSTRSLQDTPSVAPGLLILGSVPAIIRCWMNTNFKHDALFYAAVCTASYKSHLDIRLVRKLGFEDRVVETASGMRIIELPVYFPEAIPHLASSRPSSPTPQVPTLTAEFNIMDHGPGDNDHPSIQIFLGSNLLRTHNADILFSSNSMTIYDDDQCKLSIPLVRPENQATFNQLQTRGIQDVLAPEAVNAEEAPVQSQQLFNGLGQSASSSTEASTIMTPTSSHGKYRPPGLIAAEGSPKAADLGESTPVRPNSRDNSSFRPALGLSSTRAEPKETTTDATATSTTSANASPSPAVWSSWRREAPSQQTQPDWNPSSKKPESGYQRKDAGIKVLKPLRAGSRTASGAGLVSATASPSPADGRSRFFDDGKRRAGIEGVSWEDRATASPSLSRKTSSTKEAQPPLGSEPVVKTRANPIGGASAFSWLNPAGGK